MIGRLLRTQDDDGVFWGRFLGGENAAQDGNHDTDENQYGGGLHGQLSRQVSKTGQFGDDSVYGEQRQQGNPNAQQACATADDKGFGIEHLRDVAL